MEKSGIADLIELIKKGKTNSVIKLQFRRHVVKRKPGFLPGFLKF